jgi:hypothetical protein
MDKFNVNKYALTKIPENWVEEEKIIQKKIKTDQKF